MAEMAQAAAEHGPQHDYNLVDPSPWPFIGSATAFVMALGGAMYLHEVSFGGWILVAGFVGVLGTMFGWWRDVIREAQRGDYSETVASMLRIGMGLFITTEVMFFAAFFWAFFWGALYPPMTFPASWPPEGVEPVDAWGIPLLNTMILLLSGTTVTWAHHAILQDDRKTAVKALTLTVILGVIFTGFQAYEYIEAIHHGFTITDGVFGSVFYMATGFHGFHVLVGTLFLIVCTIRAARGGFTSKRHVGFEAAAWYWHFVDVVWLFLFVCVYVWGGSLEWSTPGIAGLN